VIGKAKNLSAGAGWEDLPDEEILKMRIRDLNVQIQGSAVEPFVRRLYEELDAKGIVFHPPCYLADEWLCPDKVPIIGIPFCLAHPRLKHIEQKMMYDVEGGTEESCMKLLRHECGHAMNYAYKLYDRTRWRQLFGPFSAKYSDYYYFQPYSRRYVIHLEHNYAQAHPDEDFAETFAVWLTPASPWKEKYRGWPVIKKLRYVDGLMTRIGAEAPATEVRARPPWAASRKTSTLAAHYDRKRRALGSEFQGFYDDSLINLFTAESSSNSSGYGSLPATARSRLRLASPRRVAETSRRDEWPRASRLLRRHRHQLVTNVTRWTGHRKYDIHQLLNRLIMRCDRLELYAGANETDDIIAVTALVTAIANNTLRISREGRR
jgi:hypothetical protein